MKENRVEAGNREVSFIVLGYGNQGKRHARCIERHPGAKLLAVVDIDKELRPDFYSLKQAVEAGKKPDVVTIATPNGLHVQHCLQALSVAPYVLVEKPLGLSGVEQLAGYKDRIFCVMQNRFTPAARWLKSLDFGQLYSVHINCFWNRGEDYYRENAWRGTRQMDGGCLFTQFSHFLDILLWLFGDIQLTGGSCANLAHPANDTDDCGAFTFRLSRGGIGSFNYSVNAMKRNMESSITIIAEKGTVKVGGQYMQRVEYCEGFEVPDLPAPNTANQYGGKYEGSAGNHADVIDNIVRTLNGLDTIAVTADEGIKVVNTIQAFYARQLMVNTL